jgi:protein CpxP
MGKSHKYLVSAALITASLFAAGTAISAESGERCDKRHHGKMGAGHGDMHHGFQQKLKALDLTAAQQEQVKAIMEKQKPLREARMKEMHESRQALREATRSDAYDSAKVREIANKQAALHADMTVLRVETMHQVYALLTPEQKQKWDAKRSRHGAVEKS